MDVIPWQAITAQGGGWLLTGLFIISMIRGGLIVKHVVDDIRADRDAWKETALEMKGILSTVVASQEVTNKLLRSLPGMEDKP